MTAEPITVRERMADAETDSPAPGVPPAASGSGASGVTLAARWVVPFAMLGGVLVALTRLAAQPLSNIDTYFHLRFGEEFLSGAWSLRDPGTVTSFASADWVPTQWLPQVAMTQVEHWFGLPGVAWLAGVQFLALALVLWFTARTEADPVVVAPLLVLTFIGSVSGMSMRPQVLSYVAVVLTFAGWRWARAHGRVPWLLVPLTWVWAMCHGMWPLGIVLGVAAAVALALDARRVGRHELALLAVPILSGLVAGLLTPVGPRLLPAVLEVNSRAQYFNEWGPPTFTDPQCLVVLAVLALTLLAMVRRGRVDWFTIAMVGLAGGFAVYSLRTVPVAAALLLPLAAAELQRSVGARARVSRREQGLVAGAVVAALVTLGFAVPTAAADPPAQPAWLDTSMRELPAGTRVLNDSQFGGYLMWRYPDLDFPFSGYGDLYTDDELEDLDAVQAARPEWDELVRDLAPDYALLNPDDDLGYSLQHLAGWTVLHEDDDLVMLQPPPGWLEQ